MDAFRTYLRENGLELRDAAVGLSLSMSAVKKYGTVRPYPPKLLPAIEAFTGGKVTGPMLRPDLYERVQREAA